MTDVAALSASVTLTGAAKADKELAAFGATATKTETQLGRFSKASESAARESYDAWLKAGAVLPEFSTAVGKSVPIMQRAGAQMQQFGGHTANVFSQLNDIGVMMAAGQNPLQLALQQGTQLNQVWGQMGGNIGSVGAVLRSAFMSMLNPINLATIGIIAFGGAAVNWLFNSGEAAKTFDQSLDELMSSIDDLNAHANVLSADGLEKLRQKYGELTPEVMALAAELRALDFEDAQRKLRETLGSIEDTIGSGWLTTASGEMQELFNVSGREAQRLHGILTSIKSLKTFDEQVSALANMREMLVRAAGGITNMSDAQYQLYTNILNAEDATRQLAAAAPGAGWMNAAITGVQGLIGKLQAAVAARNALSNAGASGGVYGAVGARGDPRQQGAAPGTSGTFNVGNFSIPSGDGNGSSAGASGGGGGSDPFQANLDRLMQSLLTEREVVEKWHAESELLLNDRRTREQLGEAAHKEAMLALEREYQEKMKGIKDQGASTWLGDTSKLFGDLNTLAGGGYEGLLRAQRSFAAAEALINTYRAAAQVLADPKMTFLQKFGAVASVIAAGVGLVNSIKGGGSRGRGGAGGSSSGSGSAASAAPAPERVIRVSFQGDPFMVAIGESVIDQLYDATKSGRVVIAR